jgi:hypothetical protein
MKPLKLSLIALVVLLCSFVPADWIPVESHAGKFKVLFPRKAEESNEPIQKSGFNLVMHMYSYDVGKYKDDNVLYMAMYCDYPDTLVDSDFKDEIIDTLFSTSIAGMINKLDGKMKYSERVKLNEFPGRKVKSTVKTDQGLAYIRLYLVHSRMYILMVMCETPKEDNASIERFFNSFQLTKG